MLDGSGSISFDGLAWLSEQNVPLIRIDWQGNVQSVLANNGYSTNPYLVQWQREIRNGAWPFASIWSPARSMAALKHWKKACDARLFGRKPWSEPMLISRASNVIRLTILWRSTHWRQAARRPISEHGGTLHCNGKALISVSDSGELARIGSRTSLFKLADNRNAAHPVNAILNYPYAILESQVRIRSVADGYDPTLGIMHESREGSSALVFDMMEPERPNVDRSILEFAKSHKFHGLSFLIPDRLCGGQRLL
jgi:CRISP-associated protein Cas1